MSGEKSESNEMRVIGAKNDVAAGIALARRIWQADVRKDVIDTFQRLGCLMESYGVSQLSNEYKELSRLSRRLRRKVEQALRIGIDDYLDYTIDKTNEALDTYFLN